VIVRVLILGGNGMLGHKLCVLLAARMELWATFRNTLAQYAFLPASRQINHVSVEDTLRMQEVLDTVKPDAVVNAVGIVKQHEQAEQAVTSIRVNALFPHQLADLCIERGIRAIQFSTDCVFSGKGGNYTEVDNPDPVDLYGRSKLLGEVNRPGTLTLRTSIIGWQLNTFTSLLSWFAFQRGKHIKGYTKAIYSGISTTVLAQLIGDILLTRPDLHGIYHVASEPITKYDLLIKLCSLLEWKGPVIDPDEDFCCDRSLCGAHFSNTAGWRAPAWHTMLEGLATEWPDYQKYYDVHAYS
jgi:dTDP-4-dehydrorhamnose reductase